MSDFLLSIVMGLILSVIYHYIAWHVRQYWRVQYIVQQEEHIQTMWADLNLNDRLGLSMFYHGDHNNDVSWGESMLIFALPLHDGNQTYYIWACTEQGEYIPYVRWAKDGRSSIYDPAYIEPFPEYLRTIPSLIYPDHLKLSKFWLRKLQAVSDEKFLLEKMSK